MFGGTPVIGIVLGLMLVSPILPNAYSVATPDSGVEAVMAFGAIPIVGCQGSVLTAILTALIGANIEKKLRKVMPNALDLIMTPFVVMLVTFLIVILGIGPVMHVIELGLVDIVQRLVHLPLGNRRVHYRRDLPAACNYRSASYVYDDRDFSAREHRIQPGDHTPARCTDSPMWEPVLRSL